MLLGREGESPGRPNGLRGCCISVLMALTGSNYALGCELVLYTVETGWESRLSKASEMTYADLLLQRRGSIVAFEQ